MLGIFKEQESPLDTFFALRRARELLVANLNKGVIPLWEDFVRELPALSDIQDLESIKLNFQKMTEWYFLKDILNEEGTEFFFHSPDHSQRLNLSGEKISLKLPLDIEEWQLWLEIISIRFKQNWNVRQPFASFYANLFGRSYRLSLIHSSTSPANVSKLIIRSLATSPFELKDFGDSDILEELVKQKKNILIAGATGSGKTSLLTSLINFVKKDDHLVILEDTYEILSTHPHQTRFLAGNTQETSLKSYLAYSLRLSPDRIILGEMRSHEVAPFLMAMNTGHKGLMGTIHASSAHDALHRVCLLFSLYAGEAGLEFEKVMELLCRNLEYVVFMENKKVTEIIRILGADKGTPFFERVSGHIN